MNKTIWLINEYGSIPQSGYGGRVFYLAKKLAIMGFDVYFIVAKSHHLLNKGKLNPENEIVEGVNVVSINTLFYNKSNSWKRAINWLLFNFQILFVNLKIKNKPNFIFASSPAPFVGLSLFALSRIYSCLSCFDVRDVWPKTLSQLGGIKESSVIYKIMSWTERFSMKHSSFVSSNLPNFSLRVDELLDGKKRFIWLPNGYDHDEMILYKPDESAFSKLLPKDKLIIGYVGSIGLANAMEYFIEAAKLSLDKEVFYVIAGDGDNLRELKTKVNLEQIHNVLFVPKIPKNQVPELIRKFDICYIGWRDTDLYKYGIAPNKIPEYLISGKPVLHSFSGPEDPIKKAGAGISVSAEDPIAIAKAVEKFLSFSPDELKEMGLLGKEFAANFYNYESIAKVLAREINSYIGSK